MHRLILNYPEGVDIDHINNDILDNRRTNLRFASISQNLANSPGHRDSISRFKGVTWYSKCRKWVARICWNQTKIYLGSYDSEEDAAQAYDMAATFYFKEFARLNFTSIPKKDSTGDGKYEPIKGYDSQTLSGGVAEIFTHPLTQLFGFVSNQSKYEQRCGRDSSHFKEYWCYCNTGYLSLT